MSGSALQFCLSLMEPPSMTSSSFCSILQLPLGSIPAVVFHRIGLSVISRTRPPQDRLYCMARFNNTSVQSKYSSTWLRCCMPEMQKYCLESFSVVREMPLKSLFSILEQIRQGQERRSLTACKVSEEIC